MSYKEWDANKQVGTIRREYEINFVRHKKVAEKNLLTTDQGEWVMLSEDEYMKLLKHELDEKNLQILSSRGIIMTEDTVEKLINKAARRFHSYYGGTILHLLVSTARCNHRCIYCHSNATSPNMKDQSMDTETADKVLDFIFQSPSRHISIEFQGGESLLNYDMVEYVVRKGREINKEKKKELRFDLVTNLTLMTDRKIRFLEENKVGICTSLDGPKHLHDYNRKFVDGGPTYDTVTKMIAKLQAKKIPVGILMVTTRQSLPYWKEIVDEYIKWKQRIVRIKPLDFLGFARDDWDRIGYTEDEFLEFWRKAVDYMFELNQKGILIIDSFINLLLKKLYANIDPNYLDLRNPCGMVVGQMAYNYNGDIYCCDEGRSDGFYTLGNVKTDSYAGIIRSRKAREFVSSSINENFLCDACAYKPFCGLCPVLSRSQNKSMLTSLPYDSHCKIFKYIFDHLFERIATNPEEIRRIFVGNLLKDTFDASLRQIRRR